jgi:hypothetical protein
MSSTQNSVWWYLKLDAFVTTETGKTFSGDKACNFGSVLSRLARTLRHNINWWLVVVS